MYDKSFCEMAGKHTYNEDGYCKHCGVKRIEYTRPELNAEDRKQAEQYAGMVFRKYGIAKVTVMIASLCLENIRLLKEVNEHRAARGIDPLPTFEV